MPAVEAAAPLIASELMPHASVARSILVAEDNDDASRDAGFDLHLVKPVRVDRLDAAIASLVRSSPAFLPHELSSRQALDAVCAGADRGRN
jgi:DNA-binding response OmpR family regulator